MNRIDEDIFKTLTDKNITYSERMLHLARYVTNMIDETTVLDLNKSLNTSIRTRRVLRKKIVNVIESLKILQEEIYSNQKKN